MSAENQSEVRNPQSSIVVGGTIAIDNVKTPFADETNLLGGSAAYAALAASFSGVPVNLVGIVGKDFPAPHLAMLEGRGISLDGVERSEGDSFTWSGEYFNNMNERTTHRVGLNVLESWEVKVPASAASSAFVVLANMSPDNQLQMLSQCQAADRFVIADTMDLWIEIANDRLHDVLKQLDLFVINDSEAREFTRTSNLLQAGRQLLAKGPRHVVIKLGEYGAMLFSNEGGQEQFFRSHAYPIEELTDPTGAGDCFLGGLAGYLAAKGSTKPDFDTLRQAVVYGSVVASFTCESFSTRGLEALDAAGLQARMDRFRAVTTW
ncbi:PfkB family carbohydrate kinase [Luteolibacter flavescens]|uniref:PfkB family carbohydrate kinase n=1 Tax=Luteolibacter flavescens TaxID=1859460 RepID=A0ABT3FJX2_9BACT|nr:PfkB family carbohydrate kinase [Luteolibacter flavescens]MCW1883862.1 PfkB family carbohydrate kinase [Luteolibacter flavescens]